MTTTRELLQQALKALDEANDIIEAEFSASFETELRKEIREHLARPESEPAPKTIRYQPNLPTCMVCGGFHGNMPCPTMKVTSIC